MPTFFIARQVMMIVLDNMLILNLAVIATAQQSVFQG